MSQIVLATGAALGAGTTTQSPPSQHHFETIIAGVFLLNVTAAAVGAGDTLDVYVQHDTTIDYIKLTTLHP